MAAPTPFKSTRKRRQSDPSNQPSPQDVLAALTVVANKLRATFLQPFSLDGIPQVTATGGAHTGSELPTAATIVSPLIVDLTYAHNVAAADVIAWPSRDAAVRFRSGAYVAAQNKTL